jgi:Arc/MetJ-type ribon-helix-helix transcriptional regulator
MTARKRAPALHASTRQVIVAPIGTRSNTSMKTVSLRVPESLDRKLAAVARRRRICKSAVLREALEKYLNRRQAVHGRSFLERARDLVGCVKGAPADLSCNSKHVDGFGS